MVSLAYPPPPQAAETVECAAAVAQARDQEVILKQQEVRQTYSLSCLAFSHGACYWLKIGGAGVSFALSLCTLLA